MKKLGSLCIYCGSSRGRIDAYSAAARGMAKSLVARGIRLVYGGGNVGIMGVVADATPEKLEPAIRSASGLRFDKLDNSAFPVRGSMPGSKIVYFRSKAKVYCAKYKPLPPAQTR